jgi:hypothetical protein
LYSIWKRKGGLVDLAIGVERHAHEGNEHWVKKIRTKIIHEMQEDIRVGTL